MALATILREPTGSSLALIEVKKAPQPSPLNALSHFIFDMYGYALTVDLSSGLRPKDVPVRRFLDGTVLQTFDPTLRHQPEPREQIDQEEYPRVAYVRKAPKVDNPRELKWMIKNGTFFWQLQQANAAKKFLDTVVKPSFPSTDFHVTRYKTEGWVYQAEGPDASLKITRAPSIQGVRTVLMFNAPPEFVRELNDGIVPRYNSWLRGKDIITEKRDGIV